MKVEELTLSTIGAAMEVHKQLGMVFKRSSTNALWPLKRPTRILVSVESLISKDYRISMIEQTTKKIKPSRKSSAIKVQTLKS